LERQLNMGHKVITWVDLQGRFRSTLPAYEGLKKEMGLDEQEAVDFMWSRLISANKHGLTEDHPHFLIDSDILNTRIEELSSDNFRYVAIPDSIGQRSAVGGAWEMGDDGLPQINMPIARGIQMDNIRLFRNKELEKLDVPFMRSLEEGNIEEQEKIKGEKTRLRDIPQTFDLTTDTPKALQEKWPEGLPKE